MNARHPWVTFSYSLFNILLLFFSLYLFIICLLGTISSSERMHLIEKKNKTTHFLPILCLKLNIHNTLKQTLETDTLQIVNIHNKSFNFNFIFYIIYFDLVLFIICLWGTISSNERIHLIQIQNILFINNIHKNSYSTIFLVIYKILIYRCSTSTE